MSFGSGLRELRIERILLFLGKLCQLGALIVAAIAHPPGFLPLFVLSLLLLFAGSVVRAVRQERDLRA